jgi:hypothetical protein
MKDALLKLLFAISFFAVYLAPRATASIIVVRASDVIYSAANNYQAANAGGTSPGFIPLGSGTLELQFSSVAGSYTGGACSSSQGCVTLNDGNNYNDPDGDGAQVLSSNESGAGSISGVTLPGAGELVGVFVDSTTMLTGNAPAALNFVNTGTSFASLAPSLNQVFFIGDGLTGDGAGPMQTFDVPTGAVALYLGTSDACGFSGGPACYYDNLGDYTVSYAVTQVNAAPEPFSVGLAGLGLSWLAVLSCRRRNSKSRGSQQAFHGPQ